MVNALHIRVNWRLSSARAGEHHHRHGGQMPSTGRSSASEQSRCGGALVREQHIAAMSVARAGISRQVNIHRLRQRCGNGADDSMLAAVLVLGDDDPIRRLHRLVDFTMHPRTDSP
ncbi:hypothetical protein BKG85_04880 [Mycobacteroides chelonae]|nr:hypothetical protein BKG85_04880 [Mycobacteroides chelonae]